MNPRHTRLELRVPTDLLTQLREEASSEERSVNSQLIWILRQHFKGLRMALAPYTPVPLTETQVANMIKESPDAKTTETPAPQRRTPRSR